MFPAAQDRPQKLVQPPLQSFGFRELDKRQLRSRAVSKKTVKGSKGQHKHKDFECTKEGGLVINVPTKEKDKRSRDRVGAVKLKPPSKKFRMKMGRMTSLLKQYPALELFWRSGTSCRAQSHPYRVKLPNISTNNLKT